MEEAAIGALLHRHWFWITATVKQATLAIWGRRRRSYWCSLNRRLLVLVAEEAHRNRWSLYFVGYRCQVDIWKLTISATDSLDDQDLR